jgi:SSS family solute:Na+ symporter
MNSIDWCVLCGFLAFVVLYGFWKTRGKKNLNDYILTGKTTPWYLVTISIMATQASAITFLSTPGQAYADGMRFVQFYLGLPIAMIVLSITAVPIFHRLNVYTAYQYLEQRFDLKNRVLGSVLFLIQRGLAAGFTILAPALIISVILGWDVRLTVPVIGGLVVIYTASGGTEAVTKTHLLQMSIITVGMFTAFITIIHLLPPDVSFLDAVHVAGKMGRLNAITFSFNWQDRYNFWSGLIGGTFLALSYFGTDQSQVQRYLAGSSIAQSRLGLLTNGVVKIPMQFTILFIGAMVFVFYQFVAPPLFFNPVKTAMVKHSPYAAEYQNLEVAYQQNHEQKQQLIREVLAARKGGNETVLKNSLEKMQTARATELSLRQEAKEILQKAEPGADTNDTNYIFLSFVTGFLPVGLVGLVLAAILSASMSSTAAELNALASTTVVDIYQRLVKKKASESHYLMISKLATVFWGMYAISFALFANRLGTLVEAVNILGSLFYGTILGIFLIAFYFKRIGGNATFIAALIAELTVLACYFLTQIPYLWFNVIGCVVLIGVAGVIEALVKRKEL